MMNLNNTGLLAGLRLTYSESRYFREYCFCRFEVRLFILHV